MGSSRKAKSRFASTNKAITGGKLRSIDLNLLTTVENDGARRLKLVALGY